MIKRLFLSILGLAFIVLVASQLWFLGQVLTLRADNPQTSAYMQRALAQGPVRQYWRDYDDIHDALKRAVLVAEDARFTRHRGFDWAGIRYALRQNRQAGKPVAGGSTLTQQLAKNLFLSGERSYLRKTQEAAIAMMLELTLSKERILELYLNVAQWGHQIYGAEAAAQHYFQVSASELNTEQASTMAAMLPRPNIYHFQGLTEYLHERASSIEQQLHLVAIPNPGAWRPTVAAPKDTPPPSDDGDNAGDHGEPMGAQSLDNQTSIDSEQPAGSALQNDAEHHASPVAPEKQAEDTQAETGPTINDDEEKVGTANAANPEETTETSLDNSTTEQAPDEEVVSDDKEQGTTP